MYWGLEVYVIFRMNVMRRGIMNEKFFDLFFIVVMLWFFYFLKVYFCGWIFELDLIKKIFYLISISFLEILRF